MMFLKASLVLVMLVPAITLADCPDFDFRCPSGEFFTIGTCYVWHRFQCQTCRSTTADMKSRCPRYSCGGSVRNWYDRDTGCSTNAVSYVSSEQMTEMFRAPCTIHNLCYSTPGRTKSQCDDDFLHNMRQTCRFPGVLLPVSQGICDTIADVTYGTVRRNGHTFPDFASTCYRV